MYCQNGPQTIKCKILQVTDELYGTIVLQDLDTSKLLMLTIFPNWQGVIPQKGDEGYIEFEFVEAGISKWYNPALNTFKFYNNTYFYFRQFIKELNFNNKEITL